MTRDGLGFFAVCCLYTTFWIAAGYDMATLLPGVIA